MATLPSKTQTQAIWTDVVGKLKASRTHGTAYVTLDNTISDALYPDHARAMQVALASTRAALASMLSVGAANAQLAPLLLTYNRVIGKAANDQAAQFRDLYDDMVENSMTVKSRGITFATPAAGGSNVGVGSIHRVTTDANGFPIESVHCEAKSATCVADEHSGGVRREETFQLRGSALLKDDLENTNSGIVTTAKAISGLVTSQLLSNPSFDILGGGTDAIPTSITGWTVTTIGDVQIDRTAGEYYRDYVGATSPGSLLLENNNAVSQALSVRAVQMAPRTPYYCQVAVKRNSSCDGTLTLALGNSSASVALNTLTNGEWSILKLTLGTANWFENFNENDLTLSVTLASRTTGTCNIDDVLLAPFSRFDGSWVAIVGAQTEFLRDDVFTWTDTDGGTGNVQYHTWRAFGDYLPSTSGATPTWAEPA